MLEDLARFFDLSPELLCIAGIDGRFHRVNPAFEVVLGYRSEELVSRPFFDLLHPEDREAALTELARLREGSSTIHFENRCIGKDGSARCFAWSVSPATADGLIYAAARDITRAKEAEGALRRSDSRTGSIQELRTPLTSIHGSLALLASGAMGELNEEAAHAVKIAQRNSLRLAGLLDEILQADHRAPYVLVPPVRAIAMRGSVVKVLVVDDEEDVRYVARLSLGRLGGMNVLEASSGEEGLARAKSDRPDFILLDVMMPGMDGATTFHALQACTDTASIPIVFLTTKSMTNDLRRLTDLGARGIITKPFDPLNLANELAAILDS